MQEGYPSLDKDSSQETHYYLFYQEAKLRSSFCPFFKDLNILLQLRTDGIVDGDFASHNPYTKDIQSGKKYGAGISPLKQS
jgi:hypothetical protein